MASMDFNRFYAWPFRLQLVVFGLLFLVVFYLGYQLIISPYYNDLLNAQEQETNLKINVQSTIHRSALLQGTAAQLPALQQKIDQLRKNLIVRANAPELIKEILTKGNANHLHFSVFDPSEEKGDGGYEKIVIKISAIGSYHQFANFMSEIANMPWMIVIEQFVISSENKTDVAPGAKPAVPVLSGAALSGELTLDVYQLPETNP